VSTASHFILKQPTQMVLGFMFIASRNLNIPYSVRLSGALGDNWHGACVSSLRFRALALLRSHNCVV